MWNLLLRIDPRFKEEPKEGQTRSQFYCLFLGRDIVFGTNILEIDRNNFDQAMVIILISMLSIIYITGMIYPIFKLINQKSLQINKSDINMYKNYSV